MGKVFYVRAVQGGARSEACDVFLNLPASPYELLDAVEKLQPDEGASVPVEIDEYYRFDMLKEYLPRQCDLSALNALAERLTELTGQEEAAFEGLLKIESRETDAGIPRIIDLAYSTDSCHVVDEARNDAQLGRFYAENDFVPDTEKLTDRLFEMLDFEKIGREMRCAEGGVFTEGGYVVQNSDVKEVFGTLDLAPHEPDYSILMEVAFKGQTVELPLPSSMSKIDEALQAAGARQWSEVFLSCLDCKAPQLIGVGDHAESIIQINRLAGTLEEMPPSEFTKYKAVLAAAECGDIAAAENLADTLDQYLFSPQYRTPIELAKGELSVIMGESDAAQLLPHLDLQGYGQALMERDHCILTGYGIVERRDGQPIQAPEERPQRGGMEMS